VRIDAEVQYKFLLDRSGAVTAEEVPEAPAMEVEVEAA